MDFGEQYRLSVQKAFDFVLEEPFRFREPDLESLVNPTAMGSGPTLHPSAPMDGRPSAIVRLVGPRATVIVADDPRGEVQVDVIDRATGRVLPLTEIIRFSGADPLEYGSMYSGGFEGLRRALSRVAMALERFGAPWLNGDPEAVESLGEFVDVCGSLGMARYTVDRRPGTLPNRLLKACEDRDFAKLVRLLERIRGPLTEVEQNALRYGREQLQRDNQWLENGGNHVS